MNINRVRFTLSYSEELMVYKNHYLLYYSLCYCVFLLLLNVRNIYGII